MSDDTAEILDEISGDEIQESLNSILDGETFDFMDYLGSVINGSSPFSAKEFVEQIAEGIRDNIINSGELYLNLLLLALLGAVITGLSKFLQGKHSSETAFYAVYMVFFVLLTKAFSDISGVGEDTLKNLFEFIKVLSPSYFICVAFSSGSMAGNAYYQFTLIVICITDLVLLKIVFPSIRIYFWLKVVDQLTEEDMFSKFAELIKDFVSVVIKTMFGLVTGINVVQGLVVPATSQAQNSIIIKAGSCLPGIGNTINSVATTVLCAGNLVKNAVGVVGIIAIVFICFVPIIKILLSKFLYQLTSAVIQPVSDKRIVNCFGAVTDALAMEIRAVGMGSMTFAISIALVSAMT